LAAYDFFPLMGASVHSDEYVAIVRERHLPTQAQDVLHRLRVGEFPQPCVSIFEDVRISTREGMRPGLLPNEGESPC